MVFHITKHALARMQERRVPSPDGSMNLKPAGKKTRKKIREACIVRGIVGGFVYWTYNTRYIYVCEVLAAGVYRVVTAFDLHGN